MIHFYKEHFITFRNLWKILIRGEKSDWNYNKQITVHKINLSQKAKKSQKTEA